MTNTIGDIIPRGMDLIKKEDKNAMLQSMRKIVENYNKFELLISGLDIPPQQLLQFRQLINNDRIRARKVIWGLSGPNMNDQTKKIEEENKKIKF